MRFSGFDGLRGWLAWTVVLDHLVSSMALQERFPALARLFLLGDGAVQIFIIISGFVITHLLKDRREPYLPFLVRRAMRLYPIYLVALALGAFATYQTIGAFAAGAQGIFAQPFVDTVVHHRDELAAHGMMHWLLHLTLLHGVVPDSTLAGAQGMFLGPGWSLSLEWQFYLVAPLMVGMASRRLPSIALAIVVDGLFLAYVHHRFGTFLHPSFLPGAGLLFAIGIASRLAIEPATARGSLAALVLVLGAYAKLNQPVWPLAIWAAFFGAAYLVSAGHRLGAYVRHLFHLLFDCRLAQHLGLPSYSTYLLHVPILQLLMCMSLGIGLTRVPATLFVIAGTVTLTYVLSQLAYRYIEVPGNLAGKRMLQSRRREPEFVPTRPAQ